MYKRSLLSYGLQYGKQYSWGQLQDVVRSKNELLLGLMDESGDFKVCKRSAVVELKEGDVLIALGKDA